VKPCTLVFYRNDSALCRYRSRQTVSALDRMRGLLFASPIEAHEALLITPCNSVHTFFMGYTIDVVYLDKTNTVRRLVPGLKPWRASADLRASRVIELAAGQIARQGLKTGDRCQCIEE